MMSMRRLLIDYETINLGNNTMKCFRYLKDGFITFVTQYCYH